MLGTRGHDVIEGMTTGKILGRRTCEAGLSTLQLVAYKSINGVKTEAGYLSPSQAFQIKEALHKEGVHIGLLGAYFNMLGDETTVESGKERFMEYIKYAKDFGCHLVGSETGSLSKIGWTYHPDNQGEEAYQRVYKVFRELVDEAEKHGVFVAIEGAYHHSMGSPERLKRLFDDLDSSNVLAILDPYNFLYEGNYKDCNAIIDQAFDLYGEKIAVIHAKDYILEDGKLKQVPLGQGLMDFEHLFAKIAAFKPGVDVMIEGMTGVDLEESIRYLKKYMA